MLRWRRQISRKRRKEILKEGRLRLKSFPKLVPPQKLPQPSRQTTNRHHAAAR